jgi:RHS repeat-associated protein
VYSDSNRIFKVVDDGLLNAEYIYNDVGLRTRKVVYDNSVTPSVAATTIYHYDLMGYLIAETDQAGVSSKEYIWTEGMTPVAQIDVDGAVDTAHYLHTDHLMTARFATTSSQDVSWRWEGEAFGGSDDQGVQTKINLRFPGQYFDQETGEHYNWNRYYRPGTGRYLTSDPIGLNGGGNTYGYVTGNSIGSYDSYGLFGMDDVWGGLYTVTGGWEPSQSTIDVSAGFGDGVSTVLSFGTYSTNDLRNDLGISGGIDRCSNSYNYSKYAGYAWGAGTAWAGGLVGGSNSVFWSGRGAAARAAQYGTSLERTPIGATLNWLGQSVAIPYPVWQVASATFAANARGSAIKVGAEAGNMWRTIEQPILRVRNIVINHVP